MSVPNTPEKQIIPNPIYSRKANTSSFLKHFSQISVHTQSPLNKEAYDILYPDLPPLESKSLTPQKIKDRFDKASGVAKKCLFTHSKRELFKQIVTNPIIMSKIFKELSNGDLYRLSQVSESLKHSILLDFESSQRYHNYMKSFCKYKENYRITPPSSPEKNEEDTNSWSPSSKKHRDFWNVSNLYTCIVFDCLLLFENFYLQICKFLVTILIFNFQSHC